jgi:hypothetical protein
VYPTNGRPDKTSSLGVLVFLHRKIFLLLGLLLQ